MDLIIKQADVARKAASRGQPTQVHVKNASLGGFNAVVKKLV